MWTTTSDFSAGRSLNKRFICGLKYSKVVVPCALWYIFFRTINLKELIKVFSICSVEKIDICQKYNYSVINVLISQSQKESI